MWWCVQLSQVDGSFPKNERRGRQTAMTSVSKYRIFFWFLITERTDIPVPVWQIRTAPVSNCTSARLVRVSIAPTEPQTNKIHALIYSSRTTTAICTHHAHRSRARFRQNRIYKCIVVHIYLDNCDVLFSVARNSITWKSGNVWCNRQRETNTHALTGSPSKLLDNTKSRSRSCCSNHERQW